MTTQPTANDKKWIAPFFTIWTGQALSLIGSNIAQFALVWWLTELTGSATILATATLVALLPDIILGPFVGALIDRWNRRIVMIVADSFIALVGVWLVYLFWTDSMALWHIYVVMLARSLGGTFHSTAMQASTSLLVPKEQLSRIAGANQTLFGALRVVGPPLGAFLMTVLPLHTIMAIDVVTAVFAIVPLFFIHIPQPSSDANKSAVTPASLWKDVKVGFRYIWNWPGLFWLCLMAALLNFFVSPAMRLLPILVTDHFQGEALQLGWLNSAWGGGLLVGGILLSVWGGFKKRIFTALGGIVGLGLAVLTIGLTPPNALLLAIGALIVGGITNALCNGSLFALLQGVVDPEVQGRVFTVVGSLATMMTPIGMAISGPFADAYGVRSLFVIAGIAQIVLALLGFMMPVIMTIEEQAAEKGELATQVAD